MDQPAPVVLADDIERIIRRDFPAVHYSTVSDMLEEFGLSSRHGETCRVRAACLKLAGGNLVKLRRAVDNAMSDYRDVLAPAEYPGYLMKVNKIRPEERNDVIAKDWDQYQEWFNRP